MIEIRKCVHLFRHWNINELVTLKAPEDSSKVKYNPKQNFGQVYFQAQFVQDWINKDDMETGCPPVPLIEEKFDIDRLLDEQRNSGYFEIILYGFSETLPLIMVQDQGYIEDGKRINGPYALDINLTTN